MLLSRPFAYWRNISKTKVSTFTARCLLICLRKPCRNLCDLKGKVGHTISLWSILIFNSHVTQVL